MRGRQVASGRWLLAGNVITILLTLTLATGAYGVLMGTTERARLDVRGTVDASAVSAGYDILVRPKGSRSAAEESTGLVQPGFLSAVQGGSRTTSGIRSRHSLGLGWQRPWRSWGGWWPMPRCRWIWEHWRTLTIRW